MTCLGCNLIEVKPVALRDGRVVCNSCPDWMAECEIRMVAGWPTNEQRADFLRLVKKHRGDAAADQLRADVWAWMKGKA